MTLNGKSATSGTVVVGPSDSAQIDLPFGRYSLVFNPHAATSAVNLDPPTQTIRFDNVDNPVGGSFASWSSMAGVGGQTYELRIAVFAIGTGGQPARIVHWTVS